MYGVSSAWIANARDVCLVCGLFPGALAFSEESHSHTYFEAKSYLFLVLF